MVTLEDVTGVGSLSVLGGYSQEPGPESLFGLIRTRTFDGNNTPSKASRCVGMLTLSKATESEKHRQDNAAVRGKSAHAA
jgi:hypothetical protein